MKLLSNLLQKCKIIEVIGNTDINVSDITFDSRNIPDGCLFIAIKGTKTDGHEYIEQAIVSGAIGIVCESFPNKIEKGISYIKVKNSSESLGYIASNYFDNPSSKLQLIGVTGTNGKTTIVTLLNNLFHQLGYDTGLISTVCYKINNEVFPSTHTTPDAIQLNSLLSKMVASGCEYCFMEVSSHAVVQYRITGLEFSGGVFSNITRDHLDYHKTFDKYLAAKKSFFDQLGNNAFALTNTDDKNGKVMLQNTKALKHTYSLTSLADFNAKVVENRFTGLQLNINGIDVWFKLVGSFNAYNLLAIYGTALLLGKDKQEVLRVMSKLCPAEGRFDCLRSGTGVTAIIDYAHTPDALSNVLSTIDSVLDGSEEIITVVGCGGDRDRGKRPLMAKIACDFSTKVIITSDNPRSEKPEKIIEEMMKGVDFNVKKKVVCIVNRKEAIRTACMFAKQGDIILLAGKGHEKYQEIQGKKYPFDDKQIVQEIFEELA